jgi:hypothetical protein
LLFQKRLSAGRFNWWPATGTGPTVGLEARQLQLLLWNGNPAAVEGAPLWRPIVPTG